MDSDDRRQVTPHHGIPAPLTSFVGRRQEIDEAVELLATGRLVTLVGPPGVGKTRLALAVADALRGRFRAGIWLVELAGLAEPTLVPQAVASCFGIGDQPGRSTTAALVDFLRDRDLLLVLDNCEHLIDACAALAAEVLGASPDMRILATSREGLRTGGETIVRVPALSVPSSWNGEAPSDDDLAAVSAYDAVRLFVDRGRAALPRFALTGQNAAAIARICRRLDGLPLAIELAAARISGLTPEQIAGRLDASFALLSAGSRTALPRQQTLRGAVDWSYALLSESEQALLRRLSVFAGGWTLEAAEAVAGEGSSAMGDEGTDEPASSPMTHAPSPNTLELLLSLVDKSLVQVDAESRPEPRYRLLETMRQYGAEKLAERGDGDDVRRRHRDWFAALAARGARSIRRPDTREWYDQIESEHDNLRTALAWSLQGPDPVDSEIALRLTLSMEWLWFARDHLSEGRWWMERALDADARHGPAGTSSQVVARAGLSPSEEPQQAASEYGWHPRVAGLIQASILAYMQQDRETQHAHLAEALELGERVGDTRGLAHAHVALGNLNRAEGMYEQSAELLRVSLKMSRSIGDEFGVWRGLSNSSETFSMLGDITRARELAEEGRQLAIANEQPWGVAQSYRLLGLAAFQSGDFAEAESLLYEAISRWRALAVTRGPHWALCEVGGVLLAREDPGRASASFRESLDISHRAGDRRCVARNLEGLAASGLALDTNRTEHVAQRAARLLGAAATIRDTVMTPVSPLDRPTYDRAVGAATDILGEDAFRAAHDEGRSLTKDQAVALACEESTQEAGAGVSSVGAPSPVRRRGAAPSVTMPAGGGVLTRREREVAVLVGAGLTNREIAKQLVISERTAEGHVANILARLELTRRSQIAAWAVRQASAEPGAS